MKKGPTNTNINGLRNAKLLLLLVTIESGNRNIKWTSRFYALATLQASQGSGRLPAQPVDVARALLSVPTTVNPPEDQIIVVLKALFKGVNVC